MKITRRQIREILKVDAVKLKKRNQSKITEEADQLETPETVEDAWAGGENLVEPIEYTKIYTGEENVKEPETLAIVEERRIRKIIRKHLRGKK